MQCRRGCDRTAFGKTGCCLLCLRYYPKATKRGWYGYVKFTDQIEVTETCWNWTGVRTRDGYGLFRTREGTIQMAHRASYMHYVGDIPQGYQLDHLCRNSSCVNTEHLEPVTAEENYRRIGQPPTVAVAATAAS